MKKEICKSILFTKDEYDAIVKRIIGLMVKRNNPSLKFSQYVLELIMKDLNGSAPPDIIDDCVKEELAKMETEDNKQDNEQVPTKDPEPVVNPFDGINLGDM